LGESVQILISSEFASFTFSACGMIVFLIFSDRLHRYCSSLVVLEPLVMIVLLGV
jgi:hypothetical protein